MALFDFMKKKSTVTKQQTLTTKTETNSFRERCDMLTKEGELPFGWVTQNKEFCDRIQGEFSYFLNTWVQSRCKTPKEYYSALKSFVIYLEDTEKLCKSKGECFEFWFCEILTSKDYVEIRKKELEELSANLDELQANYIKRNNLLCDLDNKIIKVLIDNPGVLQSDFVKMFDPHVQNDVREKLYFMEKTGKLEKVKAGRSYILHYKQ